MTIETGIPEGRGDKLAHSMTVIVHHQVDPGREEAFAEWLRGIRAASSRFEGYIGTESVRPRAGHESERVCVFRFASYAQLDVWMQSDQRRA